MYHAVRIDDFLGVASTLSVAESGFNRLRDILQELGVSEAREKSSPPTRQLTWIGIEFDTEALVMRIPPGRISETLTLVREWSHRQRTTRHQLQKLLGKLFYISQCVHPARLFVSRLLATLRATPRQGFITLDEEFKRDVPWFATFLPKYNGIHLIDSSTNNMQIEVDSCLTGCGGIHGDEYYHVEFPVSITTQKRPICHLEMLNILVAVKLWSKNWNYKTVTVYCDNIAAVSVLTTGRGRDEFLLQCARQIWLLSALGDFKIIPQHKPGVDMVLADALSRQHLHPRFHKKCAMLDPQKRKHICNQMFDVDNDI